MTTERTLFHRLLAAQERIGAVSKDQTNPFFNSKYADINIVIEMVKPILNDEGILFMQPLSNVGGKPAITTMLMHGSEKIEYTTVFPDLPVPLAGKKNNPTQEMGSMITYYRRYALISILGLESADDDGNAVSQPTAQPVQADSTVEVPACSICGKLMNPQKNNPAKFFCKHEKDGKVQWGKPIAPQPTKVSK